LCEEKGSFFFINKEEGILLRTHSITIKLNEVV